MALDRFSETKSNRGKTLLSLPGFDYGFEAESRTEEGIEYWCYTSRIPYCPGKGSEFLDNLSPVNLLHRSSGSSSKLAIRGG